MLVLPVAITGIAFAGIFVRLAQPAPPVTIGFYRMLFAALAMAAWMLLRRHSSSGGDARRCWRRRPA